MTIEDIRRLPVYQTRTIADACERSPEAAAYIQKCVIRFFFADFGEIGEEDTAYNIEDLEAGEGHILAKYKKTSGLDGDIYIESHFSEGTPGVDSNNTMIMYCSER